MALLPPGGVCVICCTCDALVLVYFTDARDRMAETKPFSTCLSLCLSLSLSLASNKHGKVKAQQTLGGLKARVFFHFFFLFLSLSLSLSFFFFLSFFGKQQALAGQGLADTRRLRCTCLLLLFSFFLFLCLFLCFFLSLASSKHGKVEVSHTLGGLEVCSGVAPTWGRLRHLLYMRRPCVSVLHRCKGPNG